MGLWDHASALPLPGVAAKQIKKNVMPFVKEECGLSFL